MKPLLFGLILMCTAPLWAAEEEKSTLFDHGDFIIETAIAETPGWEELLGYFVSCRLDEICMLQSLRQANSFGEPTELIKNVFKQYQARQTEIYTNYQKCRLRDIVKVKEALSICYAKLNDPRLQAHSKKELLQETANCMEQSLLPFAEKDNLFAIQALQDLYQETGKTDTAELWQKVLEGNKDNPDKEYVPICIENMHILK